MASTILPDDVAAIVVDTQAPHGPASGYGTFPLPYRLRLTDNRTRRLYVDQYGNGGGTPYVVRAGQRTYLSTAVESMVEGARDLGDDGARAIAREWQSPGVIGSELATLASSGRVTAELADDIRATMATTYPHGADHYALARLLGWVLSR